MAGECAEVTVTSRRLGKGPGEAVGFWESIPGHVTSGRTLSGQEPAPLPVTTHTQSECPQDEPVSPPVLVRAQLCATLTVTGKKWIKSSHRHS